MYPELRARSWKKENANFRESKHTERTKHLFVHLLDFPNPVSRQWNDVARGSPLFQHLSLPSAGGKGLELCFLERYRSDKESIEVSINGLSLPLRFSLWFCLTLVKTHRVPSKASFPSALPPFFDSPGSGGRNTLGGYARLFD